jgi:hypothetical protein
MSKIYILSLWGSYSCPVRPYDDVQIYLRFWKISSFISKLNGVSCWFYGQTSVRGKNGVKIHISFLWRPYSYSVRHYGTQLFYVWKYWVSAQNPNRLAIVFTEKHLLMMKTCRKTVYDTREAHIFLFRYYNDVHNFLRFWKNIEFRL